MSNAFDSPGTLLVCGRDRHRDTRLPTRSRRGGPFPAGEDSGWSATGERK